MTAEKLHDALNLLPGDLIAATDKLRSQSAKLRIRWTRWASLAACLAVLLYGGWLINSGLFSAKSTATADQANAAAYVEEAPEAQAYGAETEAAGIMETRAASAKEEGADSPSAIPSAESTSGGTALTGSAIFCEQFMTPDIPNSAINTSSIPSVTLIRSRAELEAYWEQYDNRCDFTDMQANCDTYDEAWFAQNDMLLIYALADSADTDWEITDFCECGENGWEWAILFASHTITTPGSERTGFHLLTRVEKNQISPDDDILAVRDTSNSTVNGEPFCE